MVNLWTREEYYKILWWKKIFWKEDCPLCDNKEWTIIYRLKNWYIVHSIYTYSWDEKHLLAVPYRHIKYFTELNEEELLELREVHKKIKEFFKQEDYFSFTRETMAHRSIEHLHIHFLIWELHGKYLRKMLENQGFPIKQDLD